MSALPSPFAQFQNLLREMFQFDHNELDFGLFKVLRLKRTYLFRPEKNRVRLSLNLSRPFGNMICVGKAREPIALDLLETWALLQGYWQRSRRAVFEGGKRYLCLETVCGCLVILRDITEPEDDSAALHAAGRH